MNLKFDRSTGLTRNLWRISRGCKKREENAGGAQAKGGRARTGKVQKTASQGKSEGEQDKGKFSKKRKTPGVSKKARRGGKTITPSKKTKHREKMGDGGKLPVGKKEQEKHKNK